MSIKIGKSNICLKKEDICLIIIALIVIISSFILVPEVSMAQEYNEPIMVEAKPILEELEIETTSMEPSIVVEVEEIVEIVEELPESEPIDILTTISEEELYYLAECVEIEAEGEGLEGKTAVACVILNRLESDTFPDTIKEIVSQKKGKYYQFSSFKSKKWGNKEITEETYEACRLALSGSDIVGPSLYFCNLTIVKSGWFIEQLANLTIYIEIGGHSFMYETVKK